VARRGVRLTDTQWAKIEPLLPPMPRSQRGGRPWASHRAVVDGIVWVLKTGARWRDLPAEYPSPSTCWRRWQRWDEDGTWLRIWRGSSRSWTRVAGGSGRPRSSTAPVPRPKRGSDIGPTKRGKGSKCMVLVERQGISQSHPPAPARADARRRGRAADVSDHGRHGSARSSRRRADAGRRRHAAICAEFRATRPGDDEPWDKQERGQPPLRRAHDRAVT
jgi:transposase